MELTVLQGVLLPFIGTSAGAACVFFMKKVLALVIALISIFVFLQHRLLWFVKNVHICMGNKMQMRTHEHS